MLPEENSSPRIVSSKSWTNRLSISSLGGLHHCYDLVSRAVTLIIFP